MNIKVNLGNLNTQRFFRFTELSDLLNISRHNKQLSLGKMCQQHCKLILHDYINKYKYCALICCVTTLSCFI